MKQKMKIFCLLIILPNSISCVQQPSQVILQTAAVSSLPATILNVTPQIDNSAPLIAFYSDRDGNPEIYVMRSDGSMLTRLTDDPSFDDSPALSPDGTCVVFLSARNDASPNFPDLKYELYLVDINGSNLTRLTETEVSEDHPAWSPDGSRIIFDADYDGDGFFEIYTISVDGSDLTRLTANPANDQFANWSPDGRRIAFSSDRNGNWDIYVMDIDGTDQEPLTSSENWELFPAWSPDGGQIAFNYLIPGSRNTDVYAMNADGSNVHALTNRTGFDENPVWSSDGGQIMYQTEINGNFELAVMNADGSDQYTLLQSHANELWPSWWTAQSVSH